MIVKNSVVKWVGDSEEEDRFERILYITPTKTQLYTFDIINWDITLPILRTYAAIELAITKGEAILIYYDDEYLHRPEESYTEKQRKNRDDDMKNIIEPLIAVEEGIAILDSEKRGKLINDLAKRTGVDKKTIYRKLRLFWRGGQTPNAILQRQDKSGIKKGGEVKPDASKRGRPRKHGMHLGTNIDEDKKTKLLKGYKRFYANSKKRTSLTSAFQATLEHFFSMGQTVNMDGVSIPVLPPKEQLPTLGQFKYHCHQKREHLSILKLREGASYVDANVGPKLGKAALMAFAPGDWYHSDSTKPACILVHRFNRSIELGQPTVEFIDDLFSGLIVGFYVTLEEASWLTEVLAFQSVVSDKVALCKKYYITICPDEWPGSHLPGFVMFDRGPGEGDNASNLVNAIGVNVSNTPPYSPHNKGPIEFKFALADKYALHNIEGGGPPPETRAFRDHRGLPCLTLDELIYVVICFILFFNKSHIWKDYPFDEFMVEDQIDPTPINLWNWGIENRGGLLRTMDPKLVYRNLLPRRQANVGQQGIEVEELFYFSKYGEDQQWYLKPGRVTGTKQRKVEVAIDPRTTNYIFLCEEGQVIEECHLMGGEGYANQSWAEYRALKAFQRERRVRLENNKMQNLAELNARIKHVEEPALEQAEEVRKQVGKRRKASSKDRRENKAQERKARRREDTQDNETGVSLAALETTPVLERLPKIQNFQYIQPPSFGDFQDEVEEDEGNG